MVGGPADAREYVCLCDGRVLACTSVNDVADGLGRHLRCSVGVSAHECDADVIVFFFFQAEDGIRDVAVTVQTCALPISLSTLAFCASSSARCVSICASSPVTLALAFSRSASACKSCARKMAGSIWATTWSLVTCVLKSAKSLAIVPDTCEPTCTVVTALIVPVACTT